MNHSSSVSQNNSPKAYITAVLLYSYIFLSFILLKSPKLFAIQTAMMQSQFLHTPFEAEVQFSKSIYYSNNILFT